MATTWSSAYELTPAGDDDPSEGDDRIRETKVATRERLEKEHNFDLSEAGLQPRQGLHKAGSAVAFHQASAPTTRNGVALAAADAGLLWVDSDDGTTYVYTGSAWLSLRSAFALNSVPRVERITSGSGNWEVPAGVYRIRVTCVGGGGGGGGGGAVNSTGSSGGDTTFAGATTGVGGSGGLSGGFVSLPGGGGPSSATYGASAGSPGTTGGTYGGIGGSGGGNGGRGGGFGSGGTVPPTVGGFGGGGGGGGCDNNPLAQYAGGGGGGVNISTGFGDVLNVTPGDLIAYSVGTGGAGATGAAGAGTASVANGADGGSGIIIIEY